MLPVLVAQLVADAVATAREEIRATVREEIAKAPRAWESPFLTVPEAAQLLRCRRARIDDLLSAGKLTRIKEGSRTLIATAEVLDHLAGKPTGPDRWAGQRDLDEMLNSWPGLTRQPVPNGRVR
jgi:excisionase family DNA binding protein